MIKRLASLFLLVSLVLLAAGCGSKVSRIDPEPRRLVAEGVIRRAGMSAQPEDLTDRDRYIVVKAALMRYVQGGGKPETFLRSIGLEMENWRFMEGFQRMDPTVRQEVQAELEKIPPVQVKNPRGR